MGEGGLGDGVGNEFCAGGRPFEEGGCEVLADGGERAIDFEEGEGGVLVLRVGEMDGGAEDDEGLREAGGRESVVVGEKG